MANKLIALKIRRGIHYCPGQCSLSEVVNGEYSTNDSLEKIRSRGFFKFLASTNM